jgi:hypothetical protein
MLYYVLFLDQQWLITDQVSFGRGQTLDDITEMVHSKLGGLVPKRIIKHYIFTNAPKEEGAVIELVGPRALINS